MPLRVELKPFERIVIGDSVIINSDQRTSFLIEGNAPILREKDAVSEESADTPARRLYYIVQMMYLKGDVGRYLSSYRKSVQTLIEAAPQARDVVEATDRLVAEGALYKALRELRKLLPVDQVTAR